MRQQRWIAPAALVLSIVGVAWAGHEITFYPSFYPQEITVRTAAPGVAAELLKKDALHAYIGADPFGAAKAPSEITHVESLGPAVVLTFNRASARISDARGRCAAAARVVKMLEGLRGDYRFHPYPITPYHADYLAHFDRIVAARASIGVAPAGTPLRMKARGRLADALGRAGLKMVDGDWDAQLDEIDATAVTGGSTSEPWRKAGWYQAFGIYGGAMSEGDDRRAAEEIAARLRGSIPMPAASRINLERQLVGLLTSGCERVPVGYAVRREAVDVEYSGGVENVAHDAQAGLDSAMFVRTVKLKDFPWNGWLAVGTAGRPTAAWNPVAGFTDPAGRLIWSAVGDPAFLPDPGNSRWLPNRVEPVPDGSATGTIDVPVDALTVDRATGILRPAGRGVTAGARVVYRVRSSAFHDGAKMTAADLLSPYAFAFRWSGRDATIDHDTGLLRDRFVAVKVVRTDAEIKDFGELHLIHEVPVVEVYLTGAADPTEAATIAPPWSTVPWTLTALMEEAVARNLAAFSEGEARRHGRPWLELARDRKLVTALSSLAAELDRRTFVPEPLRGFVKPAEARARWTKLRRFFREHGHWLVTNGPYQLGKWSGDSVVLPVFRDLTYPLGVGTYDHFAIPRRAYPAGIERAGDRLLIRADVETVEKFERSFKIVRGPFHPAPAGDRTAPPAPVARYVVVGDEVVAAGESTVREGDRLVVDLGALPVGDYRVMITLALNGNLVNPEVSVVPYRVSR
ncbi:MAG: hypothetical protein DMD91_08620 [Candidatus Rokuibacteriota bacterium]|nr:MAG: hypothetical protein DMD91_08620 [Candidatus Rokubacteria bacterium]